MVRTNLHTHTTFCDGKDTILEMAQKANELNFYSLGFSGHCHTGVKEDNCQMSEEGTEEYLKEIDRVQGLYPQLKLFKGIEIEASYPYPTDKFDYSILSCHFSRTPLGLKPIDLKKDELINTIDIMGGVDKFYEDYFSQLIEADKKGVDSPIIGHFDLYTKFDETDPIFKSVPDIAFDTMNYFISKDKIFEINTGAIGRGYRTTPYPSLPLLKHLYEKNAKVTISSDCHNKDFLNVHFERTRFFLLAVNINFQYELTDKGFVRVKL